MSATVNTVIMFAFNSSVRGNFKEILIAESHGINFWIRVNAKFIGSRDEFSKLSVFSIGNNACLGGVSLEFGIIRGENSFNHLSLFGISKTSGKFGSKSINFWDNSFISFSVLVQHIIDLGQSFDLSSHLFFRFTRNFQKSSLLVETLKNSLLILWLVSKSASSSRWLNRAN